MIVEADLPVKVGRMSYGGGRTALPRRGRSGWGLARVHSRTHDGSMDVELLVVPDCPHEMPAAALLRSALDDVGLTAVDFEVTVIDTAETADRRGFVGSPTILLNGVDPFKTPGQQASLACRLYPGPGRLPDLRALRQVLKRAAFEGAHR